MESKRLSVILACAVLGAACASTPQSEPAPTQAETPKVAANAARTEGGKEKVIVMGTTPPNNVVCRNEARTGSRLRTRRCFTKKELKEMSREAQEWLKTGGERGAVSRVPNTTVSAPENP